jgi:hypothetical protein
MSFFMVPTEVPASSWWPAPTMEPSSERSFLAASSSSPWYSPNMLGWVLRIADMNSQSTEVLPEFDGLAASRSLSTFLPSNLPRVRISTTSSAKRSGSFSVMTLMRNVGPQKYGPWMSVVNGWRTRSMPWVSTSSAVS